MKGCVFGVEPVCSIVSLRASGGAREAFRDRQIKDERQIRLEPFGRQIDDLRNRGGREVAASALLFTAYLIYSKCAEKERNLAARLSFFEFNNKSPVYNP